MICQGYPSSVTFGDSSSSGELTKLLYPFLPVSAIII